ncbi:MAG: endolytic transglycosylase MltG [Novosphingobium sp.]|nr:endolytic transglycosylase MltG [Novosphingobium sp.]
MTPRVRPRLLALVAIAALLVAGWVLVGWYGGGPLKRDTAFIVPDGSSLGTVATKLARERAIDSPQGFRLRARLFGGGAPIRAGEFLLPKGASEARILHIIQGEEVIRRFVTVPEGMPSIVVYERLAAQPYLTGPAPLPSEGSVLPDTYDFERGEPRQAVLLRMEAAMQRTLNQLWPKRAPNLPIRTPQEALVLASIVEKETGKPSERKMVAGLYENRLRHGMMLQADPTIIYPITRGKPLGRRIRQSEIAATNDWNTYSMVGLPKSPITNPGRASIEAVLHPAQTDALYMVADGTGGHVFASTLEQHNANVARWFAIRRARGEI